MSRASHLLAASLAVTLTASASRADRIELRGGGEIQGVVVPDPAQPGVVLVQTEKSAKPLVFQKSQVVRVTRQAGPLHEYLENRDKIPATAQSQYDFALWCDESKLTGLAQIHYEKAVAIDPEFGPAHRKLGHVLHGDRWVTYDQQREAQGLIKHKGRWISRAEKEKIDTQAAKQSQQSSWASRIKLLRAKLFGDDPVQRAEAETQLGAIRDPSAVPGLVRAFATDADAVRIRLATALGVIEGEDATDALVNLILAEENLDVRQAMLEELLRRRDPDTANKLMAQLKNKNAVVIGRAAWALAASQTTSAVPRLVEALTQSEKKIVMVPTEGAAGGGDMGGSYAFGGVVAGGPVSPPANAPQGFSVVGSYPVLTGVAVGPGVVAYGAGSVQAPIGNSPISNGGGASRPMVRRVTLVYENGEVLQALQSLTGMNFGFDRAAWRKWIGTSFRPEPAPARRVPQP